MEDTILKDLIVEKAITKPQEHFSIKEVFANSQTTQANSLNKLEVEKLLLDLVIDKSKTMNGYIPKGNLNGTFAEAQEYLGWVLSCKSKDQKVLIDTFKVFAERYNMPYMTTKYLRGLMNPMVENKNQKIVYLLKKTGFSLTPTKRYFRELRCLKMNNRRLVFGKDSEGKTTIRGEKMEKISRLANVFASEVLHRLVSPEELAKLKTRADEVELTIKLLDEVNKYQKEHSQDVVLFGETYPAQVGNVKAQDKAENRLKQKQQGFIPLNCFRCRHQIRLPLCPNIETNETEKKMWYGIYEPLIQDIQSGIHLCRSCELKKEKLKQEGKWDEEKINTFLTQIIERAVSGESCFSLDIGLFSKTCRTDDKLLKVGYATDKLRDSIQQLNLDNKITAVAGDGKIYFSITK